MQYFEMQKKTVYHKLFILFFKVFEDLGYGI